MDFLKRVVSLTLFFLLLPQLSYGDWYILIPKKRPPKKKVEKVPIPKLKEEKKFKPYSVEVKRILAPDFTIRTPQLKEFSKSSFSGKNVVFLFVGELWSPLSESLAKLFEEMGRGDTVFVIVTVNDADFSSAKSFKRLLGLRRVIVTADSYVYRKFKQRISELSLPSIVVIDRYGFIRFFSPKLEGKEPKVLKSELAGILKELSKRS